MEKKPVIATELLRGQGIGNQLFCYAAVRSLAYAKGYDFAILNREIFDVYFMDIDCGVDMFKEDFENVYHEREDRIFVGNSTHDIKNGCYVTGADEALLGIDKTTLVYGNLQAWEYFGKYRDEIKKWLAVKPEYDCRDYSRENLCIINIRGGEYSGNPELFVRRRYWICAMKKMREIRPDMEFMAVTDDVDAARRVLPEVKAHHFDFAKDYTTIKNASYLIVSNSSFAFFPAFTSETVKYIIAPKYWARHNVSDGYWASEQNIYDIFNYMDRTGQIFTADECRAELAEYKKTSKKYKRPGMPLSGAELICAKTAAKAILYRSWCARALCSLKRRIMRR